MQLTRALPIVTRACLFLDTLRAALPSPRSCFVYDASGSYRGEYIDARAAQAAIDRLPPADRRRAIITDADGNALQI